MLTIKPLQCARYYTTYTLILIDAILIKTDI